MALRNVPKEQVLQRIRSENPWWETGVFDGFAAALRPRAYFARFQRLIADIRRGAIRRAPILMGPRRVGKTILLHHLIGSMLAEGVAPTSLSYVSVEHPVFNGCSLDELVALTREAAGHEADDLDGAIIVFDEILYLRDWELHLKTLVDAHPHTLFIASGSAAAALRLKSIESGAGRFTDFLLPPLTFHEYVVLLGRDALVEPASRGMFTTADLPALNELFVDYLNFGGYPEVALSAVMRADPARYVKQDIIDKVLLRDLPSLYGISDIQELNSLFTTLAFNTANEISLDKLSQRANVAKNTVKRYLEYLEAAFLVRRIERVDITAKRFERANFFKVYLTNPSLRAALFSPVTANDEDMGALVETAVLAQWFHAGGESLHYARWKHGEVDLVQRENAKVMWACEVKWSDRFAEDPGELVGLVPFCTAHALSRAYITTRTVTRTLTRGGVEHTFVPASLYCYTIGHNLVRTGRAAAA